MLSKKLKEEIKLEFYGKLLHEIKLFRFNFSKESRDSLALCMEEKLYGPGEIIYCEEDNDDRVYFIIKG